MVPFNGAILWHVCTRLYSGFLGLTFHFREYVTSWLI